jgi:uncharacterized phage protein (TIGR02218 family)
MPAGLIAFLQTTPFSNIDRADLFVISLPTGETLYATTGQFDITLIGASISPLVTGTPGWKGSTTTFYATKYGVWSRGDITSEASFSLKANTMTLTCVPQQTTMYPGLSLGILAAVRFGLFDGCSIAVYTTYMPMGEYGNVSYGIETKMNNSTITKAKKLDRVHVEFEVSDCLWRCGEKIPNRLFQPTCPWVFAGGDGNCSLNVADYTIAFTQSSASTVGNTVLTPTTAFTVIGAGCVSGYFTQGVVTCTAGANKGLACTVLEHASGILTMQAPWILPIAPGDTFSVVKGCDKTLPACIKTVKANGTALTGTTGAPGNSINFGGTPFLPPETSAA